MIPPGTKKSVKVKKWKICSFTEVADVRNRATWLPNAKAASGAFTEAGKKGAWSRVPASGGTVTNCSTPETTEQDSEVT